MDTAMEKNLCYKAWQLLADSYGIAPVAMHLHKLIPTGAGLGGGSSDASFTLKMLNTMFQLNLNHDVLRSLAVQLGMDCPFFIGNVPALSTGRGEFLEPVTLSLNGLHLLIVKPPVHVSTAAAFAGIKPLYRENLIHAFAGQPVTAWRKTLHNDFEKTVFDLYPDIEEIKNEMYRHGAIYAALSGSGSAVYGLFEQQPSVQFAGCQVFKTLFGSEA